ncbi:conserved hypothetical protein [uncultured Sporomusa sp.]|uniref:Uncharacterized protein n=2 Tax=uncultured Sporomusa sp. TaxID=307249 RepID=A0A212LU42_9FIRM|nr:conserved hypothetical protein [uncultured Sporomusa sp.]
MSMKNQIEQLIVEKVALLNRPDLFRRPIVSFSSATDSRYSELKEIIGPWHLNPTELLPDAQSVISYFVPFTSLVVAEPKTVDGGSEAWGEAYAIINPYFNDVNQAVIQYLSDLGYSASAVQATHTYDPKDMKSMWSHRSAAAIAGLGTFGANRMLITEKGSGGRFCSVLTSATLHEEQTPAETRCLYVKNGSCGLCFKICPVNALVPDSFDKFICQDECNKNQKQDRHGADTCGKCISICPVAYID